MTSTDSLLTTGWEATVERLGGVAHLAATARRTRAFLHGRVIRTSGDLLRLVLAYCLGQRGLRSTASWAAASGLANISNVGLLWRLRRCDAWLTCLIGHLLVKTAPVASHGRLIRLIDATTVPKAAAAERRRNGVWRIHSAFDLPSERFGHFELTEEKEGEQLDRIAVVPDRGG